jgi:hypothetical protein
MNSKEKVQNLLVELIGDGLMLIMGLIGAYYIKIFIIG